MTEEVEYILKKASMDGTDLDAPFTWEDIHEGEKRVCECGETDSWEEVEPGSLTADDLHTEELDGETYYVCPICDIPHETAEEALACCENETLYRCTSCGKLYTEWEYEQLDYYSPSNDVYEWWAVGDWFGERLEREGEAVIESYGKYYWGRRTTGQSISLDYVINVICYGMGILEGQQFSWEELL